MGDFFAFVLFVVLALGVIGFIISCVSGVSNALLPSSYQKQDEMEALKKQIQDLQASIDELSRKEEG